MAAVTKFDEKYCHKWALLLRERREKLNQALTAIAHEDFDGAKRLFSEVFKSLHDFNALKGKCGVCEYRALCGGCRARAYGLSSDFIDYCGDLHEPAELKGDYLTEAPWVRLSTKEVALRSCRCIAALFVT